MWIKQNSFRRVGNICRGTIGGRSLLTATWESMRVLRLPATTACAAKSAGEIIFVFCRELLLFFYRLDFLIIRTHSNSDFIFFLWKSEVVVWCYGRLGATFCHNWGTVILSKLVAEKSLYDSPICLSRKWCWTRSIPEKPSKGSLAKWRLFVD